MKRALGWMIIAGSLAVTDRAAAWDGLSLWHDPADGAAPGGGGIIGAGGAGDYNITCEHCHVDPPTTTIDAAVGFTPALAEVAGMKVYSPGQTYQVQIDLVGEFLGLSGCGPYAKNINNFAARFESGGQPAGALASDSGQSQTMCPFDAPMPPGGTTALYRVCDAVLGLNLENVASWTFSWRAPDPGGGLVTLSYGVVDGDCGMMSMGDAVKMGKLDMGEAAAAAPRRSGSRGGGALAVVVLAPLALLAGRRRSLALVAAAALAGCGGGAKEDGTLGGPCLPGDVCNAGLMCEEGVCVTAGGPDAGPGDDAGAPDVASPPDTNPAAPTCVIGSPDDPAEIRFDEPITFMATASDPEDGPLAGGDVMWSSSLAGQLGTGLSFTTMLVPGVHTVTCTATDSDGNTGTDTVQVTVKSPYADIFHPGDGEMRAAGSLIPFVGVGRDAEDGDLSGTQLIWTSDLTGMFGEGEMFTVPLTAGTHVVTLTVTDTEGNTDATSITLIITP